MKRTWNTKDPERIPKADSKSADLEQISSSQVPMSFHDKKKLVQ